MEDLRALLAGTAREGRRGEAWTGWVGYLSYELGRVIEPAAGGRVRPRDDRGWPVVELHRVASMVASPFAAMGKHDTGRKPGATLGALRSGMGRAGYVDAAARVVEYIRAGDVFQANIAHRLSAGFRGSAVELFDELAGAAGPWYGAYIESADVEGEPRRAVLSLSPELFLEFDARTGRVVTRPMKGTRAVGSGGSGGVAEWRSGGVEPERGASRPASPAAELAASGKDASELNMIVDLMRNDLGRVCRFGSVRVEEPREIERHGGEDRGGVYQGVATVSGFVRGGLGIADLIRAAFPGGSVTGAPKIRAMQIIDELEPVARGPYCGAVCVFGDDGRAVMSMGIRTALITGTPDPRARDGFLDGVLDYSVGAGIVAESEPLAEWRETLDKAGVLKGRFARSRKRIGRTIRS